jgi:hypothetical protein
MYMAILIAAAVATTIPCIVLWLADQRDRLRSNG